MKIGIIVPFRKREAHLAQFIPHMRARFKDAFIGIIEQYDDQPFNRGKLINIGFAYYRHLFDYFAAHDVDMLPTKADYSYPENPTHIATKVEQFKYKMPFDDYFGGVTLFNNKDYETINGFSNNFWGWGGEDDELRKECEAKGLIISRRDCMFSSLHHTRKIDANLHAKNVALLNNGRCPGDGLTGLQYEVVSEIQLNYTHLKVKL
jgi:hypothetical protein